MHPSLWADILPTEQPAAVPNDAAHRDPDVIIIGGGYSGLWTAVHLLARDPGLRVTVVERHQVGWGASGRNGGWLSALTPESLSTMAARAGRDAAVHMQRLMHAAVAEVVQWTQANAVTGEGDGADVDYAGTLTVARDVVQERRLRGEIAEYARFGFDDDHYRWLDADEARTMVAVDGARGGLYTPHCAAIHPMKLVLALASHARSVGVAIVENCEVTTVRTGRRRHTLTTSAGTMRAPIVIAATEAFGAPLPGQRRWLAPIYSLMIATAPLPASELATLGWRRRCTLADGRRMVIYAQRTADGRIVFGGRGAWYHLGSRTKPSFDVDDAVHQRIRATMIELFPSLSDVPITHRWGGAVAAARDWAPTVHFDPRAGVGRLGGYVGDGVTSSYLAAATLADLVTSTPSERVAAPWVNHESPRWEPEPLRWLGVNAMIALTSSIDRSERGRGVEPRLRTAVLNRFVPH